MYFTYSNILVTCYSGGSIQRWQFLTHKNFLALKCPRKSSHAWFTYLNFKTKISSEKHLKLIMNKAEKMKMSPKMYRWVDQYKTQITLLLQNTRQKWAKQLLKKGFGFIICPNQIVDKTCVLDYVTLFKILAQTVRIV